MTSKKFPPIPPYYPASSEKWDYPRPGEPAPESRDYQKPYPEFPAPIPPTGIQYPALPDPTADFYRVPAETPTNRELAQMVLDAEDRAEAENAKRLAAEARHVISERDKAIKESRDRAEDVARAEMTAKATRSSERAKMTDQNLQSYFQFEGKAVRHKIDGLGDPWFVLDDVCEVLGLENASRTGDKLDADEKGITSVYTPGGQQNMIVVSEGGLYTIILRCRDAVNEGSTPHRFRKWVTSVVLPSIRKTGGYGNRAPERSLLDEIIADPVKASVALAEQAKKIQALSSQNAGLADHLYQVKDLNERFKHGLNTLVALMSEPDGICLRDAANQLGQPQHAFNLWLKEKGWIYKNERALGKKSRWKPHAAAIAQGLLGDKDWIRSKSTNEVTLYNPEMGYIDPNDFYVFKEVEVTRAGMVKILQYTDFPNPNVYAIQITRKKFGVV